MVFSNSKTGFRSPSFWEHMACEPQQVVVIIGYMKQYVVDQLRHVDYESIKGYLDQRFGPAFIGGVYWVPIDPGLLSPTQSRHVECRPFFAAVELQTDRLSMELLVRTQNHIRCDCIAYATDEQRNWLIRLVDDMLAQLGISV
jgi:hypothetical protein